MKREDLRLELLKLTYAHGRDVAEAVGRAKVLETYVWEQESDSTFEVELGTLEKRAPGRPRKNAGNAND